MALYLKYRPKDFDSLVWQDFIKNTLQKATAENKTVGAYLLCWPRWTGKTSTARILAKAVNCENPKKWNPCNKCYICEAINNENQVDVIEIDAASNTWVDNIRELISKAQFRPTSAKYKIYIIDEVHMLSKWAFNALLKILEEPPEFVKFILATTETHKVPETIISRCQRFDFKNISETDLNSRLEYIASKEKIDIDKKSLEYIVKNSAWWLRNAISTFEQLIEKSQIKYDNIIENLWIVNNEKLEDFLEKLISKDTSIIENYEDLISEWKNIKLFFKELIFYTKNKTITLIKEKQDISNYLNILEILDDTYSKTKNSLDENTTFLIWLMKILNPEKTLTKPLSWILSPSQEKEATNSNSKEKIEVQKKEIMKEPKEEIKIEDIWDIFWDKEKEWESKINNSTSSIFNKKELIKILKEMWVKWWLTMWLLWADIYNNWEILEISYKTPFAYKQANTTDNITAIKQALEKMNMWNIKLKLK